MNREELEALRAKVSCEAVLERAGYQLDVKESTRRAIKYRDGGNIIIVRRREFDPSVTRLQAGRAAGLLDVARADPG
jgi:hypothetical protein